MNPLIKIGIQILEVLFVIGAIGSAIVMLWVGYEDFRTMFKPGGEE